MTSTSSKEAPARLIKKVNQEIITPHKLTITILIRSFVNYRESDEFKLNLNENLKVKYRRDFCILSQKLLESPDINLSEMKQLFFAAHLIPPAVIRKFDASLSELSTNGIGCLLDIIDSINKIMNPVTDLNQTDISVSKSLMNPNTVSKNSVIGFFLRRFILSFEKLTLSEVSNVYQTFLKYYNQWKNTSQFPQTTESKSDDWYVDREQWSRRQANLFLTTQAALLHNEENKALPPKELQKKISSILKSNPDLANAHFLSFLNYLRVEEYCGAVNSLFHCFDRKTNLDVKCFNDEKSKEHRYAALNLAILYYYFGHIEEALAALKEAIKIAHEANDNLCLQHALSWLYRLSSINKDNLIIQCVIKSFELNISYTTSLALQNFSQFGSSKGSVKPSLIFETLTKSDMLNCQHNYKDLIFSSHIMKAALWQLYGKTEMASLWSQTLLYLNIDTNTHTSPHYGEGYCIALCNTANTLLIQGDYSLCNTLLNYAKRMYPNEPNARIWMLCENMTNYTRSLYHEKWDDAEAHAQKIIVLDKFEGYLRLAELYFYKQDYEESNRYLNLILKNYTDDEHLNDGKYCLLKAKLLLAEVQFASTYPNYSNTFILLNNCLNEAETPELSYHVALIHLQIAHVLLTLGLTGQALRVLTENSCMIEILANGGKFDKARATLLYVKCIIADSQKLDHTERSKVLLNAVTSLENVKKDFEKVEAYSRMKDVLYLQGQLYNILNMRIQRNKCAMEYKLISEDHISKNVYTLVKYL